MKINMKEWIASILGSEKRIAIPVMTHSGIELLGHTVYDAVTNGEIHARAVKLLAEKYPSAASSVIMDLTDVYKRQKQKLLGQRFIILKMKFLVLLVD